LSTVCRREERSVTPNTTSQPSATPIAAPPDKIPEHLLWKLAEQGVVGTATFDRLLGAGKNLWADDAAFNQFLAHVRETRAEKE
jgi:hypothetical protein